MLTNVIGFYDLLYENDPKSKPFDRMMQQVWFNTSSMAMATELLKLVNTMIDREGTMTDIERQAEIVLRLIKLLRRADLPFPAPSDRENYLRHLTRDIAAACERLAQDVRSVK